VNTFFYDMKKIMTDIILTTKTTEKYDSQYAEYDVSDDSCTHDIFL